MAETIVLNRDNYRSWVLQITKILQTEGLYSWIHEDEWPDVEKVTPMDKFKINQSKQRAAGILKTYVSHDIELIIGRLDNPAEIWKVLKDNLEISGRAYKQTCYNDFRNLKLQPDEDIPTFIARFEEAYKRVQDSGETLNETLRCYQLIGSLPEEYDYLAREFNNLPDEKFKLEYVKGEILSEVSRKENRDRQKEEIFAINNEPKQSNKQILSTPTARCKVCMKIGHISRFCRTKVKTKTDVQESNTFITEFENDCYANEVIPSCWDWTLDSASTSHVCQNLSFFTSMKHAPPGSIVKMGMTPHVVRGIGTATFKIREGKKITTINLKDVLYVPNINKNLISMSKMDKAGLHAKLDNGIKIFSSNWKYLYTAHLINKFCVLRAHGIENLKVFNGDAKFLKSDDQNNEVFVAERDNIMLWHERLGHSHVNIIKQMVRENLIEGCNRLQGKETTCEACVLAKNTKASHPRIKNIRSKELLELIHSDVWGPAPVTSRNGHRYILTFIDDYSRRAFCYPLKTKDEVPAKFLNFITFIERQTGKKLRVIRTDNGLEYCNQKIHDLCNKLGIKHEKTSFYSPQMNGVAERYNRVLFEGVRTFSQAANLPDKLWVEAAMATNYIRNRVLHTGINAIPFQRWYKVKPSVRHLKRYGCVAFLHQPKQKRNKFQPRAKKGILVGYGLGSSGYRIWFPDENKIIESKHVQFDESQIGRPSKEKVSHNKFFDFDDKFMFSSTESQKPIEKDEIPIIEKPTTSTTPTLAEISPEDKIQLEENSSDEDDPSEIKLNDTNLYTFHRYLKKRVKGASTGRIDVYILAPCGTRLRSGPQLQKYCEEKNLKYDDKLANFSQVNTYQGPIILEKASTQTDEALITEIIIPKSPKQAKSLPQANEWIQAMNNEMGTMIDRKVWTPVPRKENVKVIGTRWVFTIKRDAKGNIATYKARLVALGNNQREGLDYNETFSPVVNFSLIRLFIIIFACILKWSHCLLDIKCAYLYGNIDYEIFIKQPTDYVIPGKESYLLKLNKAIYGLHQAGRCWFNDLHHKLISNGFLEVPGITCVYTFKAKALILVYVDDLPIFAENDEVLQEVVQVIEGIYEVRNLGEISTLLGINFRMRNGHFFNINCEKYIGRCLENFNADSLSRVSLPALPGFVPVPRAEGDEFPENLPFRSLLGSMQYISHRCRPDIAWTVASLSQYAEQPSMEHYRALSRTLLYLSSTRTLGLKLHASEPPLQLVSYVDASWASEITDRKSWTGYTIFLNDMPVQWRVIKQTCVALSPMEAEFIAASEAAKDIKFIQETILEVVNAFPDVARNLNIQKPLLLCDSTAAIAFTKNKADNVRNRHIDLKYKFLRDLYERGLFDLHHVSSKDNVADILTKSLCKDLFVKFRKTLLN